MNNRNSDESAGHLAWCGLVALGIARKKGQLNSPLNENVFLTRWLAEADRKRIFPKTVAENLRWLIEEGKRLGPRAGLAAKLNYIWKSGIEDMSLRDVRFRFHHALEAFRIMGWTVITLTDDQWEGDRAIRLNRRVSAIYINRSSLDAAFTPDGHPVTPVKIYLTGNISAGLIIFRSALLITEKDSGKESLFYISGRPPLTV